MAKTKSAKTAKNKNANVATKGCYWLLTLLYIFFLNMRDTGETRERPPSPPTCGIILCIGKSCHLMDNAVRDAQSYTAVNPT